MTCLPDAGKVPMEACLKLQNANTPNFTDTMNSGSIRMRLVGTSMVKNEEDIIEVFVRHNLCYLDALVVVDNFSADNTRLVLAKLMREGLPLCVADDPRPLYLQSEMTTNLLRSTAAIFQPAWVFPLDSDEFLAPECCQNLCDVLATIPLGYLVKIPWVTYVTTEYDDSLEKNAVQRIRYHRKNENPQWYKVGVPSAILSDDFLVMHQGNHSACSSLTHHGYPECIHPSLKLAHYPVRSVEQLKRKAIVGWLAYLCDANRTKGNGLHWENMYHDFLEDESPSHERFLHLSMRYAGAASDFHLVEHPIRTPVDHLSHYPDNATPLLKVVCKMAENIIAHSAPVQHGCSDYSLVAGEGGIVGPEGGWSKEVHHSLPFCDVPPFRYLLDRYCPVSVLDIGCGMGAYLKCFVEWGVTDVVGVEANDMGSDFLCPGKLVVHNLENELHLGRMFDLVLCLEVIEHLAPQFEDLLFQSILRHGSRIIVFSAAQPNQPGIGHRNLKPISHWVRRFQAEGWLPDPFASLAFRAVANLLWFKRNPVVFTHPSCRGDLTKTDSFQVEDLWSMTEGELEWPAQKPNTYEYTLMGRTIAESFMQIEKRLPAVESRTSCGEPPQRITPPRHAPGEIPLRELLRYHIPAAAKKALLHLLQRE